MNAQTGDGTRPAVFLDRDGTVIEEVDYLADPKLVRLTPGGGAAVRRLNEAGFCVVIVTNQSGIARGILDESRLAQIHAEMERQLALEDARIDHIEFCPHHPDYDGVETPRRKPEPGMLLDAARAQKLDLGSSWMIGDAFRDVQAGHRAGTRTILVETGKGARERERALASDEAPHHVATNLSAATDWLLAQGR